MLIHDLNPVYSPPVDGNAFLSLVTAQEGRNNMKIFPNHYQHHRVSSWVCHMSVFPANRANHI